MCCAAMSPAPIRCGRRARAPALAIFLGPHAYVSPNWYPSKAETGKAVPTWNYITVHARGRHPLGAGRRTGCAPMSRALSAGP